MPVIHSLRRHSDSGLKFYISLSHMKPSQCMSGLLNPGVPSFFLQHVVLREGNGYPGEE